MVVEKVFLCVLIIPFPYVVINWQDKCFCHSLLRFMLVSTGLQTVLAIFYHFCLPFCFPKLLGSSSFFPMPSGSLYLYCRGWYLQGNITQARHMNLNSSSYLRYNRTIYG